MTTDTANPTAGDSGASNPDPIARLENFLAAQDGDTDQPQANEGQPADDKPAQAAKSTDSPKDGATGEDTEPQITTAQLAKVLGVDESLIDVDEDGSPVFKTKVDGAEGKAKFQDFLKTHQLQGHAENRAREAAAKEAAAERKMQEADQAVQAKLQEQQQQLQQVYQLAAIAQQELQGEVQSINWPELYGTDAKRAKELEIYYSQRSNRIQGVLQQLQQRANQAKQQAEQATKENEAKALAAQEKRLVSLIPEWSDRETGLKEMTAIRAWSDKSNTDISDLNLQSASAWFFLRQAWRHATLQAAKPEIEKKLRDAPKLVKPGAAKEPDTSNSAKLKDLKAQVKESGGKSTKAAADWLLAKGLA